MERNEIKGAVKKILHRVFQEIRPGVSLDRNGYTTTAEENLIDSVFMSDFEEDLGQGGGNELNSKFRAVHSSSALAVNVFGPFKRHLTNLILLGEAGFDSLEFEKKCLTGLQGQPPNLDVVAQSGDAVIGIESKFTEYLQPHVAKFSDAYREKIRDGRRKGAWFEEMRRLTKEPDHYTYLDAAQLIKHAFGLWYTFRDRSISLLYVYWEPTNARMHRVFRKHREEIDRLAERVVGSTPAFRTMSYAEVWRMWENNGAPDWLRKHVERLYARYGVAV